MHHQVTTFIFSPIAQPFGPRSRTPQVVGYREPLHKRRTKMHQNATLFRFFVRDSMIGHFIAFWFFWHARLSRQSGAFVERQARGAWERARLRLHPLARSPNSIPYSSQTNNVRKLFIFSSIFLCQRCACAARRGRSKSKPAWSKGPPQNQLESEKVRDFAFKSPFSSLAAAPLHHPRT